MITTIANECLVHFLDYIFFAQPFFGGTVGFGKIIVCVHDILSSGKLAPLPTELQKNHKMVIF